MSQQRAILQVTGRLPSGSSAQLMSLDRHLAVQTLLRLIVRDEAALQGVLRRLHGLGLELVEIRPIDVSDSPRMMEAVVAGPVGDLALESLSDYIEVRQVATRINMTSATLLTQALTLLLAEGLTIEYATAPPSASESRPEPARS